MTPQEKEAVDAYHAMHARLNRILGSASRRRCIDCGGPAMHWSYNNQDVQEVESPKGPWSPNIDAYDPRCITCHNRFDGNDPVDRLGVVRKSPPWKSWWS